MMAGRYMLIDQGGLTEFLPLALEKDGLAGVFNSGILATGSGSGRSKYDYTDAPKARSSR